VKRSKISQNKYTFGTCSYERTSPGRNHLSPSTKIVNIIVPFEEALKLNIAVDECVRKLNSYNKATTEGKRAALNITVHLNVNRIAVNGARLKKKTVT
jgi:hypothetical protein